MKNTLEVSNHQMTKCMKNTGWSSIMLHRNMRWKRKKQKQFKKHPGHGFTSYVTWVQKYSYTRSLQCIHTQKVKKTLLNTIDKNKNVLVNYYHWFGRKIWFEFGTNNTTVTMRPCNLAPYATVMGSVLLHLGLVDICHFLAGIPSNLFLSVHSFNLDQRCVWVLVYFGSKKQHKTVSIKPKHLTRHFQKTNIE